MTLFQCPLFIHVHPSMKKSNCQFVCIQIKYNAVYIGTGLHVRLLKIVSTDKNLLPLFVVNFVHLDNRMLMVSCIMAIDLSILVYCVYGLLNKKRRCQIEYLEINTQFTTFAAYNDLDIEDIRVRTESRCQKSHEQDLEAHNTNVTHAKHPFPFLTHSFYKRQNN